MRDRRRARRAGRWAETVGAWLLRFKGYRILAQDYRVPVGEIDLLARRGGVLVAAEVKLRPSRRAGAEAVTPRQRRRIARAVEAYIARHPDLTALNVRFDVVLVVPWHRPHHIMDAWRP